MKRLSYLRAVIAESGAPWGYGNTREQNAVEDRRDAWIAFVLSVAIPGAGQIWRGRWSGVIWLMCGALLIAVWALVRENAGNVGLTLQYISFLILGLLSGLHASRRVPRGAHRSESVNVE